MAEYRVEVYAFIDIQAESRREVMRLIKEKFENGDLTHEDLNFDIVYDSEEDKEENT